MTEYVLMPGADYQNICNALRKKTGSTEPIRSGEIPDKIENLPDNDHYDTFWDSYQDNGKRTDYMYGFAGEGWNDNNFYPKYNPFISANSFNYAFYNSAFAGDLAERMARLGFGDKICITRGATQTFRGMRKVTRLPIIDYSGMTTLTSLAYVFSANELMETIDKIILPSNIHTTVWDNAFTECRNLKNIRFEGTIGKNIHFLHSSLLSAESVQSIIDCLKDLTGATTQTLTLHADVGAKLTAEHKAILTVKNWTLVY